MRIDETPLSLAELTGRIGMTIQSNPAVQNVWVVAELSDVAVRGGHFYADLIQKDDAGSTLARLRANLWANRFASLRHRFMFARNDDLRNGIKVKLFGNATHHNQYGLSFNITDIDENFIDEGDMLRRRMEILRQLETEGVAEENKNLQLPADTQRIAIISAPGAAGLGDFINQLDNNTGGFKFSYKVFDSPMQGEKAAQGVINALYEINEEMEAWDCVVIIRGGGATSDMNCFDDLRLARNVCMFQLPVIVGIGHERDNCVLDYIAHTRCKTPTAVAEFLVNHQREAWQRVYNAVTQITREVTLRIEGEHRRLAQIEAFIPAMAQQYIEKEQLRLNNITSAIPLAISSITSLQHARLENLRNILSPAVVNRISRAKEQLKAIFNMVEVLKPENTLKRGFSITRVAGKAIREASQLADGEVMETQLADGIIMSKVTK